MAITDFFGASLGLGGSWGVIVQLFLIVGAVVVVNFVASVALKRLHRSLLQTRTQWDDAMVDAARAPLYWLIWLIGIAFAAEVYQASQTHPAAIFEAIGPLREVGVIALLAWFLLRTIRRVETSVVRLREAAGQTVDRTTVDAIGKLARLTVVITATLVILQTLGFSVAGVLAFGGVGGIAVGFAARDLLANFFGGLTVYLDRPFSVGDWIRSPDRNIEGTVEHIGWRQTRIRTFDQRPLYVPNATFNEISLENPSRMLNRRIWETLGIRYRDADKMAAIVGDVRQMLRQHDAIDPDRTLIVNFTSFGPSSLDFFIYTFTKTTEWVAYHEIKQDVLLKVLAIIDRHGAEIAFPTSTLHLPEAIRLQGAGEEAVAAQRRLPGSASA